MTLPDPSRDESSTPVAPLDAPLGIATLTVASDLLRSAMHMPRETQISGAEYDARSDQVLLTVRSPDLPPGLNVVSPWVSHTIESYEWHWGVAGANGGDAGAHRSMSEGSGR
jgi:hypothetical protein